MVNSMDELYDIIINNKDNDMKPIICLVQKLMKLNYIESVMSVDDVGGFVNDFLYNRSNSKEFLARLTSFKKNLLKIKAASFSIDDVMSSKASIINQLLILIEELGKKRRLKLNDILCDGVINKSNLEFALSFLYDEDKIMNEFELLKTEKEDIQIINGTNDLLKNFNDIQTSLLGKVDEIIGLFIDDLRPSKIHIIDYFRWFKKRNYNIAMQENILVEIKSLIDESVRKRDNLDLKYYCLEDLTSLGFIYDNVRHINMNGKTKKMFCDLKDELSVEYSIIVKYIEEYISNFSVRRANIDNPEHLKKLSTYFDKNSNNYINYVINNIIKFKKSKLDTLFFKSVLILKFILNSQCSIDNLYNHSLDDSIKLSGSVISEFSDLGLRK